MVPHGTSDHFMELKVTSSVVVIAPHDTSRQHMHNIMAQYVNLMAMNETRWQVNRSFMAHLGGSLQLMGTRGNLRNRMEPHGTVIRLILGWVIDRSFTPVAQ